MTNTETAATPAARKAALFAKTPSATLATSMTILDTRDNLSGDERLTFAWICQELEDRHPEVAAAVAEAFDAAATQEETTGEYVDVDYPQVIRDGLRAAGVIA